MLEREQLLFKEYTWYLRAFCRERSAWRVFKLMRMKRFEILDETFVPRKDCGQKDEGSDKPFTLIDIRIDGKEAYRIYDRFEEEEIEVLPDGNFMVHMHADVDDWVYGVILGVGPSAEVTAPDEIRQEVIRRIQSMTERYGGSK